MMVGKVDFPKLRCLSLYLDRYHIHKAMVYPLRPIVLDRKIQVAVPPVQCQTISTFPCQRGSTTQYDGPRNLQATIINCLQLTPVSALVWNLRLGTVRPIIASPRPSNISQSWARWSLQRLIYGPQPVVFGPYTCHLVALMGSANCS